MPIRTVVCQDCQEPLPHGRLSCPRCGAPLASVAGAYRAPARLAAINASTLIAGTRWPRARAPGESARAVDQGDLDDASEPLPGADAPVSPGPEPQVLPTEPAAPSVMPPSADEIVPSGAPGDVDDVSEPAPPDVDVPSEARNAVSPDPASADDETWPFLRAAPVRRSPAVDDVERASEDPPPFADRARGYSRLDPGTPAGAYVPPTEPVVPPGTGAAGIAASTARNPWGLVRSHRAPRPSDPVLEGSAAAARHGTAAVVAPRAAPPSSPPRSAGDLLVDVLADLPFRVPPDTPGRLAVAGSALAGLAFLLPWTSTPVLGGGYTAEWGFAVGSYVAPWLAAVGLLLVSLLPNELPGSVRAPAVPLALGGVLLGLAWPYVLGPAESHVGSWAVAAAGIVLIAGGVTALRVTTPHGSTPSV